MISKYLTLFLFCSLFFTNPNTTAPRKRSDSNTKKMPSPDYYKTYGKNRRMRAKADTLSNKEIFAEQAGETVIAVVAIALIMGISLAADSASLKS